MRVRRVVLALGAVTASAVLTAAPAFAGGPPVPAGCTFDQTDGVLSCITGSSTTTTTEGPFTTDGGVPVSTTFAGVTGLQLCDVSGTENWTGIGLDDVSFTETVTTTTTTQRHGLHGKLFSTSTTTSAPILDAVLSGDYECAFSS